jgi:hypothetical protein
MIVVPSLETLQVDRLKWHERTNIIQLYPIVINVESTMISKGGGNTLESSVHLFMFFTIQHKQALGMIA